MDLVLKNTWGIDPFTRHNIFLTIWRAMVDRDTEASRENNVTNQTGNISDVKADNIDAEAMATDNATAVGKCDPALSLANGVNTPIEADFISDNAETVPTDNAADTSKCGRPAPVYANVVGNHESSPIGTYFVFVSILYYLPTLLYRNVTYSVFVSILYCHQLYCTEL